MTILTRAQDVVDGDRQDDYGHPKDNHSCTAALMEAYMRRKWDDAPGFDATDVCIFNILQKISRLAHTPGHRDSLVDIAGWARNIEMLYDKE
jgi:hypothetical protein